jgi:hypothetical protein
MTLRGFFLFSVSLSLSIIGCTNEPDSPPDAGSVDMAKPSQSDMTKPSDPPAFVSLLLSACFLIKSLILLMSSVQLYFFKYESKNL